MRVKKQLAAKSIATAIRRAEKAVAYNA